MSDAVVPERVLNDEDDVKAILNSAKVDMNAIKRQARRNNTLSILGTIIVDTRKIFVKQYTCA